MQGNKLFCINCGICIINIDYYKNQICDKYIFKIKIIQKWFKRSKYANKNNRYNIILWKIAEYYMKKKYNPKKILEYVNLD